MMKTQPRIIFCLVALGLILSGSFGWSVLVQASPALDDGLIAFAGLSADGSRAVSIRTIRPDGSSPQTLYTTSQYGAIIDVAWSPDGREIAFIDKAEAVYSLFNQDIFAIRPDGSGLRRASNPPRFGGLPGGYQTGTVSGILRNNSGRYNVQIISLYIQGATQAVQGTLANPLDTLSFSLNVADLGSGEMQYLVVIWSDLSGGPYREIVPAIVDVLPGQTVNLGTADFVGQTNQPNLSDLSWSHNGSLLGIILENGATMPWQFDAAGQAVGAQMANISMLSTLALSPNDQRMAYWRTGGAGGVIALNQIGGSAATEQVILTDDVASLNYDRHIAWLPDGSGLVISVNGDIYDYIIATQQVRQLTNFKGVAHLDRVTVSPDGTTVAFSYSLKSNPSASDIWLLNRQTLQLSALTTDGRSAFPSWSRVNPPTPTPTHTPSPTASLTATLPPGVTPTATATPPPQNVLRVYLPTISR